MAIPPLFPEWPHSAYFLPVPSNVAEYSCFTLLSCVDMTNTHSDSMNLGPQLLFVPGRLGTGTQGSWVDQQVVEDAGSRPQPASEVGPCQQVSSLSLLLSFQVSPGVIANPFAAGLGHRNSLESISSIDRELSPEGPGKVRIEVAGSPGLALDC